MTSKLVYRGTENFNLANPSSIPKSQEVGKGSGPRIVFRDTFSWSQVVQGKQGLRAKDCGLACKGTSMALEA